MAEAQVALVFAAELLSKAAEAAGGEPIAESRRCYLDRAYQALRLLEQGQQPAALTLMGD